MTTHARAWLIMAAARQIMTRTGCLSQLDMARINTAANHVLYAKTKLVNKVFLPSIPLTALQPLAREIPHNLVHRKAVIANQCLPYQLTIDVLIGIHTDDESVACLSSPLQLLDEIFPELSFQTPPW